MSHKLQSSVLRWYIFSRDYGIARRWVLVAVGFLDHPVLVSWLLMSVVDTVIAVVLLALVRLHPELEPLLPWCESLVGSIVLFKLLHPVVELLVGRSSGGRRLLTRQARSRHRNSVRSIGDSSLSSLQFESLCVPHTRSFSLHPSLLGRAHGVDVLNLCGVMHDARMNSLGTSLHSACNDSGVRVNSNCCAYTNSSGGGSGWNKAIEYEYSVQGSAACCVEACLFTTGVRKTAC